ncbi:MAGUK p55 subfamily member 5 [Trichonephila clavata]|uniref:MAGUK p55 subfamily member 5 n=1 Tax=Trichonephila clavata TaxID=2740835 RepID=A0A8X6LSQ0_TRICU|nr:MAGUK p55 subfamily member 5 [Trichonephila clavata]
MAPVHREMAVDVPDSFVGVTKTAPRYPPPRKKPPRTPETSSLKKNGLYHFSADPEASATSVRHVRSMSSQDGQAEAERRTPPTPRISELMRKEEVNGNEEEKLIELGQLHRIRKYQEEIRKRKEDEEKHAKEEEFLRSSLRGSQKLRALEKQQRRSEGLENSAFLLEEGDDPIKSSSTRLVASTPEGEPPELTKLYEPTALLDTLHNLEASLVKTGFSESLVELEKLFHNPEFQSLLTLHNKVQDLCCFKCLPTPVGTDAQVISLEVVRALQDVPSKDAKELLHILGKHPFENLMFCHDKIAASQIVPDISEEEELLSRLSQYTEESIKIVRIEKTTEPLGATVKNDGEAVIVGRIVKGGIAEKSGLLHEGDEILEVNGIELRGKSVNDVCDIMASMSGTLTFLIVPSQYDIPKQQTRESVIHLKAHFDYEPDDDLYIPCRELGMSFQKGDVLHVISQEDSNWWQAYREGEEDQLLAGLIPSKNFQQQREVMKQAVVGDVKEKKSKKGKFLCAKRHHRRKKKKMYNLSYNDDTDAEQILTYEEVRLYYPRAHQKRPLVLIGPQKVGRHELRQRLMEDTNRFAAAVPHTSRTKKDSEVNGVDYFFISRTQFEADILAGRFVEHGEYQKSYYGTSLDAIRSVIESGKTCVLNLHPQPTTQTTRTEPGLSIHIMEQTNNTNQENYTAAYLEFHKAWESNLNTLVTQLNTCRTSEESSAVINITEELDSILREFPFTLPEEQSAALRSLRDVLDEARFKFTHKKTRT